MFIWLGVWRAFEYDPPNRLKIVIHITVQLWEKLPIYWLSGSGPKGAQGLNEGRPGGYHDKIMATAVAGYQTLLQGVGTMKKLLASVALFTASAGLMAAPLDDLRLAAEENQCLEAVIGDLLQKEGVDKAQEIVTAAYQVLAEYADRQKELGCSGSIGQAAIAAGADPNDVLAATAAGLGAPGAGGITNLGGLSGSGTGGGGFASPS